MPTKESIKTFWNNAAKDDPYWFISSFGQYGAGRNLDEFWASGHAIWSDIKRLTGYEPQANHTVVEIGCGIGRLTRAISQEVRRVTALDISENMLEIARGFALPNAEFRTADGFSLNGIPDGSADFILAYCVFQHLPDLDCLKEYLGSMERVAKRDAIIAFTLCPRDWKWNLLPLIRAKGFIKSKLGLQPPDLYKKEWLGIRPSLAQVTCICPIHLSWEEMDAERVLFWGRALGQ